MANPEHLAILKQGVEVWNKWREVHHYTIDPDLSGADLRGLSLDNVNFNGADLRKTNLGFEFQPPKKVFRKRPKVSLPAYTQLASADLREANLEGANIAGAMLLGTNLSKANLHYADLSGSMIGGTTFGQTNLSLTEGLEEVKHASPSTIGMDTIYLSGGKIPESFLLGCGLPQSFIDYIPSLIGAVEPFQYKSCFISYSTKDDDFAKRLHSRLRDAKVRVWFAPEDMKGGKKIHEQIEQAIQVHDRLLLVLSEHSIKSNWVETEIRRALEVEKRENRRKLFPILLTDYETIRKWRCFDADSGRDLAIEVREYFMPDFSNWKDHESFERGFKRLLRDLKEAE